MQGAASGLEFSAVLCVKALLPELRAFVGMARLGIFTVCPMPHNIPPLGSVCHRPCESIVGVRK